MASSDALIVMDNLAPGQARENFEQWLRDVDLPGYAKVETMSDPVYYRCEADLEGNPPPDQYVVAIKATGSHEVDEEMSGREWESFVADFERRTRDAVYVSAERIIPV